MFLELFVESDSSRNEGPAIPLQLYTQKPACTKYAEKWLTPHNSWLKYFFSEQQSTIFLHITHILIVVI